MHLLRRAARLRALTGVRLYSHEQAMDSSRFQVSKRYEASGENVWVEFSRLGSLPGMINIGQGFPDLPPPLHIRDALAQCVTSSNVLLNQYTRAFGHPRLVKALANLYGPLLNRELDWQSEVLISVGAYGCLYNAIAGHVNPGDEVIVIEPFFDCYKSMIAIAGGKAVYVPLRPTGKGTCSADWKLDPAEFRAAFSNKTKAIILNNPNNPLGKVFSREELEDIATLVKEHDVLVISDEVYEWLIYQPHTHIRFATLRDMWDRTITIGSAGKTFSVTGWKLGWTLAPASLLKACQIVHQNTLYVCPTPLQEAVAVGLELEAARLRHQDCYFNSLPVELKPKRDLLAKNLAEVGMEPIIPEGGYFMMADTSKIDFESDDPEVTRDYAFARWLAMDKEDSTMEKASQILKDWASS